MISIQSFVFNPFEENTYLLYDATGECVIIDPGCYEEAEKHELIDFIQTSKLKPVRLLNTHCHIDHVFGNKLIADRYGLKPEIDKNDLPVLHSLASVANLYSIPHVELSPEPEKFLKEGDEIHFGNSLLEIAFTPGHSPGHLVFFSRKQEFVISGDLLFYMSIGRTDLPGGDYETLLSSIREKIFPLGDNFTVYPGHGQKTTIGFEKKHNPFLQ